MSYPGRPPIVPGISIPPSIGIQPYMPSIMPQVMTMPPLIQSNATISMPPSIRPYRSNSNSSSSSSRYSYSQPPKRSEGGPSITVFVGNIVEHAPDMMIRHILNACGQVISWKRIQGFGFCEFGSPESALRAVRLLHDMEVGTKKLVVKVDAKTKVILDEYKKEERKKQGRVELKLLEGEELEPEDYLNDNMRRIDMCCQDKVYGILEDFEDELQAALVEKSEEAKLKKEIQQNLPDKNKSSRNTEILNKLSQDVDNSSLKDSDIEDGKRDIITREIGKFREIMKKQEAEREEERARRELEKQAKGGEKAASERSTGPDTGRSRSTPKSNTPSRSKTKSPTPTIKHRIKDRKKPRTRSRSRDRERDRDRSERERERDKDRLRRDMDKATAREKEEEEEAKDRRKLDKKAREKEATYQERLRNWETRERRKNKEFEKDRERERYKDEEMAREAKKLKEFLEDYDDDRDDLKYYKGRELARRLSERDREKELDNKDRQKEKEEIEELKNKIMEEEHEDPTGTYEKLLKEREELYKPKILIDVNAEQMRQREKEREREERERQRLREMEREREREEMLLLEEERRLAERELAAQVRREEEALREEIPEPSPDDDGASMGGQPSPAAATPSPVEVVERRSPHGHGRGQKKKKLDVKEVFNTEDDEENSLGAGKRRKLVPLDYPEEKDREHRKKKDKDKDKDKDKEEKKDDSSKSQEEKRKHIKSLIDKIPTEKSALFGFSIDWSAVDNQLMERRIRPWIHKKIIEYIGEPEPTLVDFICSKVLAGSQPQGILDDVQMVLDDEAEVFVVKMWRLLIYEIEAKKLGLVK